MFDVLTAVVRRAKEVRCSTFTPPPFFPFPGLALQGILMSGRKSKFLAFKHRSEGFAHPMKRWVSFLVNYTVWIDDVKIWKVR